MTKQDVADTISKKTDLSLEDSKKSIEAFMEVVNESLKAKKPIFLRGFGTFLPKKQAAKVARNISKGTQVAVPARLIPAFKPCPEFKKSLS